MIEILVGSQMGAAEYAAEQVAETLEKAGYEVKLHLTPDLTLITRHSIWLVVTSTYGAGDLVLIDPQKVGYYRADPLRHTSR